MSEHTNGVAEYVARGAAMAAAEQARRVEMRGKRFDTIAVHGLYDMQAALANQGSIIEPGFMSSAQHFENSDHMEAALAYLMPAWVYSRIANPTVHYLEETLALLEGYGFDGETSALATSSGMSAVFMATNPFLAQAEPGTNIVASARCYGGTFMLFSQRYGAERGIDVRWVCDPLDLDEWASKIDDQTRFVYGETPSNPSLSVMDIDAVAELAHAAGVPLIVDSTVATPALMRPLTLGADIVVHSTTKSMTSSGLAVGGAVIARHGITTSIGPAELAENFAMYVKLLPYRDHGPGISRVQCVDDDHRPPHVAPSDGLHEQLVDAGGALSRRSRQVDRVAYPGLASMPGHDIAARTMWLVDGADDDGRSGQSIRPPPQLRSQGWRARLHATCSTSSTMIWRATDLGRIKSVATIPAISTHQQQGDEGRALAAVPPNLIRLNVGGEHPEDIIADLDRALAVLDRAPSLSSAGD